MKKQKKNPTLRIAGWVFIAIGGSSLIANKSVPFTPEWYGRLTFSLVAGVIGLYLLNKHSKKR